MIKAPYPADTRAKGWRFELDYEQIEQSTTWARTKPEARPWLLMLWMLSWKQVPCGSLPDDQEAIAGLLGVPDDLWAKNSTSLLRGWWGADDGRLYHDTLTARVLEMMSRRRSESDRKARGRMRQAEDSGVIPGDVPRDSGVTPADVPRDSGVSPPGLHPESGTEYRPPKEQDISNPAGSHPPAEADGPATADAAAKTPTIPCPYDRIIASYHELLPSLPAVRLMRPKRQAAIRTFWAWVLTSRKTDGTKRAEDADGALAWIAAYFARAAENDFLMGRSTRSAEHAGWQCDIDFLLTDKGMKAVIEKTQERAA